MGIRPFVDTLNALRYGQVADELSDKLNAVVLACIETGKAGELTLKIKVKPGKAGQMELLDEIKAKLPEFERGSTLLFGTPEGNLQREDPRQMQLTGLRQVDAETSEIRKVG